MKVFKAGALYFLIAFVAGFALGPIRVLWVAPRFGERAAELMVIMERKMLLGIKRRAEG